MLLPLSSFNHIKLFEILLKEKKYEAIEEIFFIPISKCPPSQIKQINFYLDNEKYERLNVQLRSLINYNYGEVLRKIFWFYDNFTRCFNCKNILTNTGIEQNLKCVLCLQKVYNNEIKYHKDCIKLGKDVDKYKNHIIDYKNINKNLKKLFKEDKICDCGECKECNIRYKEALEEVLKDLKSD
ncbi:17035_t:CDS:1, partial [Funneliformis caledonium]